LAFYGGVLEDVQRRFSAAIAIDFARRGVDFDVEGW